MKKEQKMNKLYQLMRIKFLLTHAVEQWINPSPQPCTARSFTKIKDFVQLVSPVRGGAGGEGLEKTSTLTKPMAKRIAFTLAEIKPSKGFCKKDVIANECEAISNKLKDCHVAIAPRNDAKCCVAFTLAEIKPSRVRSLDNKMTKSLKVSSGGTFKARRSVAFTLAEILITLAIIGIVSAMTIPTLITKNQKMIIEKRITQDYSILNQAIRLQTADGLDMSTETIPDNNPQAIKNWYDKYWAPYLKTAKVCIDTSGCWQNKGVTKALSGQATVSNRGAEGIGGSNITVRLLNGTSICINSWYTNKESALRALGVEKEDRISNLIELYVDANGDSPPNTVGKDIYVFIWTEKTNLVPAGYSLTGNELKTNCSKNATGSWSGYFCLARIKQEGWKILDEVWDANK